MKKEHKDFLSGSIITILCILIYLFLIPAQVQLKEGVALGTDFFPKLVVGLTGICSLVFTLLQLKTIKESNESIKFSYNIKEHSKEIVFLISAILFLIFVEYLGFPITATLLLIFHLFFFGSKGVAKNIILAVFYIAIVYCVFNGLLKISFPPGIFGI